jgi:hypothetical protein
MSGTYSSPRYPRRSTKNTQTQARNRGVSDGTEREKGVNQVEKGSQKKKKSKKGAKKKKGGAQTQRPPSLQRSLASQYKFNPETGHMMDMMQDEDWSLCDKDCG